MSIATTRSLFKENIESDKSYCVQDQMKVPPLKIRRTNDNFFTVVKVIFYQKCFKFYCNKNKFLLFLKTKNSKLNCCFFVKGLIKHKDYDKIKNKILYKYFVNYIKEIITLFKCLQRDWFKTFYKKVILVCSK